MGIWAIIEKVCGDRHMGHEEKVCEDRCMNHKEKDGFMGGYKMVMLGIEAIRWYNLGNFREKENGYEY